jgi:hypothetical protein
VGDPQITQQVESALRSLLGPGQLRVEESQLRPALRRLRLRDLSAASPDKMSQLAEILEVSWFLAATLHEVEVEPLPRITLSARVWAVDSPHVYWAGFTALTGADGVTWLALGGIDTLSALINESVRRLLAPVVLGGRPEKVGHASPLRHAFLHAGQAAEELGSVAVVPFDSITDRRPGEAADLATAAAEATLHEAGYSVLFPGLVASAMRGSGQLLRGELDAEARAKLAAAGADRALTGIVETYVKGSGLLADPHVAFAARLLDTGSGRIVWMGGDERFGSDAAGWFYRGKIRSGAGLMKEIMRSVVAGFSAQ